MAEQKLRNDGDDQPKYKLTDESKVVNGITVYRIRFLKSFTADDETFIEADSLGGFVESQYNLSQKGNAVILDDAVACGQARVIGSSMLRDQACVSGHAVIEDSYLSDNVLVTDRARVTGDSSISGNVSIGNSAVLIDCLLAGEVRVNAPIRLIDVETSSGRFEAKTALRPKKPRPTQTPATLNT
jgi:UDP-3-O-[3-hydroxymyristoyl] glucosamine N-acyltransferase